MIQILHYLPKVNPASFNVHASLLFVVGVGPFHTYEHISISKFQPCNAALFVLCIRARSMFLDSTLQKQNFVPFV